MTASAFASQVATMLAGASFLTEGKEFDAQVQILGDLVTVVIPSDNPSSFQLYIKKV